MLKMEMLIHFAEYPDSIATIVENYVSIIDNTQELSSDDKRAIYIGLSIAKASSQYWNSEIDLHE